MEDTVLIEPDGVYGQEEMEILLSIPFLVIDEPELPVGACHDAMMAWPEHIPAATGDRVARVFHERAGG